MNVFYSILNWGASAFYCRILYSAGPLVIRPLGTVVLYNILKVKLKKAATNSLKLVTGLLVTNPIKFIHLSLD